MCPRSEFRLFSRGHTQTHARHACVCVWNTACTSQSACGWFVCDTWRRSSRRERAVHGRWRRDDAFIIRTSESAIKTSCGRIHRLIPDGIRRQGIGGRVGGAGYILFRMCNKYTTRPEGESSFWRTRAVNESHAYTHASTRVATYWHKRTRTCRAVTLRVAVTSFKGRAGTLYYRCIYCHSARAHTFRRRLMLLRCDVVDSDTNARATVPTTMKTRRGREQMSAKRGATATAAAVRCVTARRPSPE